MAGNIWVSAAGMQTRSWQIDTLAQDIANVNTTGFRSLLPVTGDVAPMAEYAAGLAVGPAVPPSVLAGGGVGPEVTLTDTSPGPWRQTGQPLDVAILGPGLFALRTASGDTVYTRAGRFELDAAGHLVDPLGRFVLDTNGQPITVPPGSRDARLQADGSLTVQTGAGTTVAGRIGVAVAANPQGMVAQGSGVWAAGPAAGPMSPLPLDGVHTRLATGALEDSNADLTSLLPQLLAAQRAYDLNSRAFGVGLKLWSLANGLHA